MSIQKQLEMHSIIEIDTISKSYSLAKKTVHALQDISLIIEKGDVYGIIGVSGAGKSTLIRCLSRLIKPTSGKILFHGIDIAHMPKNALRNFHKSIGMVFQHFNLLSSRTVAGNIAYPMEIANVSKEQQNRRIDELLGLVNLTEKKAAYPSQLSGGEKQRVGIARALANHPEILLCDEATSALDPKTTREVLDLLKNINKKLGVTIALITHDMGVIKQICNKVAVIENGRIEEQGLVSEVFANPKHKTTKSFLQRPSHEIPPEFLKEMLPNRKLLRLRFKTEAASSPILSEMIKKFNVHANILLGWIDRFQTLSTGSLIIELTGSSLEIADALNYLSEKAVHHEVIENEL